MEMGFCMSLVIIPLFFGFALECVDYGTVFITLGVMLIVIGAIGETVFHRLKGNTAKQHAEKN
jgi:hypothetical protein